MDLDVLIEDDRWALLGVEELGAAALLATFDALDVEADMVEVSLLACDDARIAVLNEEFRGKPTATNVLSWPVEDLSAEQPGKTPAPVRPDVTGALALGDLAISYDTCAREADAQRKSLADHATHLIVHGTLHLLGYDHTHDADAALMEGLERKILGKMGLDDPYRDS